MTREQAYKLADTEKLFDKDQTNMEIIHRAMGIFAGAFAEWVDKSWYCFDLKGNVEVWTDVNFDDNGKHYTTPELIAEFEKID